MPLCRGAVLSTVVKKLAYKEGPNDTRLIKGRSEYIPNTVFKDIGENSIV